MTGLTPPVVEDIEFIARAAVGGGASCDACCDVLGTGTVTITNALAVLRAAIGLPVEFACPTECTGLPGGNGGTHTAEVVVSDITCEE